MRRYRSKPHRDSKNRNFREIQYLKNGKWYVLGYSETKSEANRRIRKLNKRFANRDLNAQ